jgi:hypothetical protein
MSPIYYLVDTDQLLIFQVTCFDSKSVLNRHSQGNGLCNREYLLHSRHQAYCLLYFIVLTAPASITQSVANSRLALESRAHVLTVTAKRLTVRSMCVATIIRGPRFDADSGARGAEESIVPWRSAPKNWRWSARHAGRGAVSSSQSPCF